MNAALTAALVCRADGTAIFVGSYYPMQVQLQGTVFNATYTNGGGSNRGAVTIFGGAGAFAAAVLWRCRRRSSTRC
jgi:hypothetical protein